ncbi:MAG: hypothetical protein KAR22_16250, partial [Gammaproteobacteria bacterium]|nr:hypothetical protein [Gammaproteobacteria bacterium]
MRFRSAQLTTSISHILSAFALCALLAVAPARAFATLEPVSRDADGLSVKRHFFVLNGLRRVPGQWG